MSNDGDINAHPDRAHDGKPKHIDLTKRLPEIGLYGGAEKVEVDGSGNIISGTTNIGEKKLDWKSWR